MTLLEKAGFVLSILLIGFLLFLIIFSKNGLLDHKKLKTRQAEIVRQMAETEKKNQELEREIDRLKNDINYIKHLAKHEHEMVEEGELIFKSKSENREGTN